MTSNLNNNKVNENMMVEQIIDGHPFFEDIIKIDNSLPQDVKDLIDNVDK